MPNIRIGDGTEVVMSDPAIKIVRNHKSGPGETRVHITQTIKLSFIASLIRSPPHWVCIRCGALPPLPDAHGAQYILANNNGDRLHFPVESDAEPARDGYPVSGWSRIAVANESMLLCTKCTATVLAAVRPQRSGE